MKRLLPGVGILVALAAGIAWADERPNFSGDWVLNSGKSTLATKGIQSGTVRIEHKEPAFSFQRTFITKDGPDESRYDLTTDGKEKVEVSGGSTRRSRLYWEGDQLVLDEKIEMAGRTATNVVRYRLENEGKTLVAREAFRAPRVQHDNVWVFDRK